MMEWKQREINYKVWDGKKMHTPADVLFFKDGALAHVDNWELAEYEGPGWTLLSESDNPKLRFLQYTGLKDKNGKEIYEGDIARDISGKVAVIVYSPPSFFAQFKGELWDINTKGSPVEMVECIEVIGNIFENPELLEDKP